MLFKIKIILLKQNKIHDKGKLQIRICMKSTYLFYVYLRVPHYEILIMNCTTINLHIVLHFVCRSYGAITNKY